MMIDLYIEQINRPKLFQRLQQCRLMEGREEHSDVEELPPSPKRYEIQGLQSTDINFPESRFDHLTVYSKNKIYVLGGMDEKCQKYSHKDIYHYCLEKKTWTKVTTDCQLSSFDSFEPKYGTIIGNRFILFGDNGRQEKNFTLWKLTLDSFQWVQQEQRGQCPALRQGACLLNFEKNQILYFGGNQDGNYSNQIYLYNIDSKSWHLCKGSYQYSLKERTEASMVNLNGKVYLFGGFYKGLKGPEELNDLYEITIKVAFKNIPAQASVIKIKTKTSPPPLRSAFMFPVSSKDLCILGRESQGFTDSVWHYSTSLCQWTEVALINKIGFPCEGSRWVQEKNHLWKFGGLKDSDNEEEVSVRGDFLNLTFHWDNFYLTTLKEKTRNKENQSYSSACKLCHENRLSFFKPQVSFSCHEVDQLTGMIQFPYAAFGLLTDNSVAQGATSITIHIDKDSQGSHFIKIDDNSKHPWKDEELYKAIFTLGSSVTPILVGCDKKIKKDISRKKILLQFGCNLKLGSLRLGKSFLYISTLNNTVRVAYCFKKEAGFPLNESQYVIEFYSFDIATKALTDPSMAESKRIIDQKYYKFVREALECKSVSNTVLIFDTLFDDPQETMKVSLQSNDVILGAPSDIETLRDLGYDIDNSIDVSLKSYLSCLYLADTVCEIIFGIGKLPPMYASIQHILEKIDKQVKNGSALELKGIFQLQFDFKKAEFYVLRDMRKSFSFFNNGLLLYSHNRLITRFKPMLGTLVNNLLQDTSGLYNCTPLFGYAELPDGVSFNLFKTNFCHQIMFEGLYSRFKMVEENFKRKITIVQSSISQEAIKRRERKPEIAVQPIKQLPWKLRGFNQNRIDSRCWTEENQMKSKKRKSEEDQDSSFGVLQKIKMPDSDLRQDWRIGAAAGKKRQLQNWSKRLDSDYL